MKTLQQLLDWHSVHEVLLRYYRGLDRADFSLVRACFADDAHLDYRGSFEGGPDKFMEWLVTPDGVGDCAQTMHLSMNTIIETVGNEARSENYVMAYHTFNKDSPMKDTVLIMWLRYIDRLHQRDGEWLIVDRRVVVEMVQNDSRDRWENFQSTSRRDRTDPSYMEDEQRPLHA